VTANELLEVRYTRVIGTANFDLTARYEIKDSLGAVRQQATLTQVVTAYPVSLAAILSGINTAQGT
jgi:hypothetical protein